VFLYFERCEVGIGNLEAEELGKVLDRENERVAKATYEISDFSERSLSASRCFPLY
jgi:hypothetical protein